MQAGGRLLRPQRLVQVINGSCGTRSSSILAQTTAVPPFPARCSRALLLHALCADNRLRGQDVKGSQGLQGEVRVVSCEVPRPPQQWAGRRGSDALPRYSKRP